MNTQINNSAMYNIGYGLYVVTCKDENKDNGLIVNTVAQLTTTPNTVMVTINKTNYSHDIIQKTGVLNVNCLTEETPFEVFEHFGFQSGKDTDKFVGDNLYRSQNGIVVIENYTNAYISLKVLDEVDLATHTMFICEVTQAQVLGDAPSMTYAYYHKNVKPKPQKSESKKGWVCKICGYVHEGENLPQDFICPICKHGVADFEKL